MASTPQVFSPGVRRLFLAALRSNGIIGDACRTAGVTRATVDRYRREDEEFAEEFAEALEDGVDQLELAAFDRAVNGVEKNVYYKGELVEQGRVYSDSLLALLLTRKRYPERVKNEIGNLDGQPFQTMNEQQRAAGIAGLLELARARKAAEDNSDIV